MISTAPGLRDTDLVWSAILEARKQRAGGDSGSVEVALDLGDLEQAVSKANAAAYAKNREAIEALVAKATSVDLATFPLLEERFATSYLDDGRIPPGMESKSAAQRLANWIAIRSGRINGDLTKWTGYAGMLLNVGAFFGMYGFGAVSSRIGRRPAFLIAFLIAAASAILLFSMLQTKNDVLWMFPLMGVCVLAPFAGYAIYFPELFPTRLRSTGTSFCYNVGRYLAATGPLTLGYLTGTIFVAKEEPLRWAGVAMCSVYLIGIAALPFAQETKDQPLPE